MGSEAGFAGHRRSGFLVAGFARIRGSKVCHLKSGESSYSGSMAIAGIHIRYDIALRHCGDADDCQKMSR
jgi:hypothetical protein